MSLKLFCGQPLQANKGRSFKRPAHLPPTLCWRMKSTWKVFQVNRKSKCSIDMQTQSFSRRVTAKQKLIAAKTASASREFCQFKASLAKTRKYFFGFGDFEWPTANPIDQVGPPSHSAISLASKEIRVHPPGRSHGIAKR